MRTEEEAKFDLDEQIFASYDSGLSIESIAESLATTPEYVVSILGAASVEIG